MAVERVTADTAVLDFDLVLNWISFDSMTPEVDSSMASHGPRSVLSFVRSGTPLRAVMQVWRI